MAKELKWNVLENGCWDCYSHSKHRDGHVYYKRDGYYMAHRYIYAKHYGDITSDQIVRHKCDNPSCVNPDHLELGTHKDNVQDRVDRNRSAIGINNGRSKLNENNIREIRKSELSNLQLSKIFNVDRKAIYDIRNFNTWKHVQV